MSRPPARTLLAALALLAGPARAAPAPGDADRTPAGVTDRSAAPAQAGPPAISLTIAGGVSLGAYEAGQLHYVTEVLRANPHLGPLRLVTGASAGSTNGLMTILATCAPAPEPVAPDQGLFWKTWIPLGFSALWREDQPGGRQGAFSRAWMERLAGDLEATFRAGLREDCDVVLGVSVTRVVPRQVVTPSPGLALPRMEEKFALRVQGRGPGRPPRLTNYASATDRWPQPLLPEGPDGEVAFESLRELIFASTAFPLAFPPQRLRHCLATAAGGAPPRCPAAEARADLFVDGGLFDNSPLRLAARLASTGLRDGGRGEPRWLDAPGAGAPGQPSRTTFAYVTPDAAAYPAVEAERPVDDATSALELTGRLAGAFVTTARAKNLIALLEEYPEVADRIQVPLRHYPAASDPMAAFLGFFEQDFRTFDFQLGAADARRMITEGILPAVRRARPDFQLRLPDAAPAGPAWRPLGCLRAALEGLPEAAAACQGEDLASLRILAQASLLRLWDQCARLPAEAREKLVHAQCRAAAEGRPPPLVPGVPGAAAVAWRRAEGEGEVVHAVRLLAGLRFPWRDLGLEPGDGEEAMPRLRERLGDVTEALSDRQPSEDRLVVRRAGGLAANALAYGPPRWLVWTTLGRQLELGASRRVSTWRHATARVHAALQVHGVHSALSNDDTHVAPALLLGLELRPRHAASGTWQPSLLLRAGAVLSPHDGLGARACPAGTRDPAACTRGVAQVGVAVSVLESARLQLTGEWYPHLGPERPALWAVSPALGLQVAF